MTKVLSSKKEGNMKMIFGKQTMVLLSVTAVFVVLSGSAHAALEVRGLGTVVSGGSGQYQLIYDTVLDIT